MEKMNSNLDQRTAEKVHELKQKILTNRYQTVAAKIFNAIDRVVRAITRRRQPVSWIYSATVLALVTLILECLISVLFNEVNRMREYLWVGIIGLELAFLSVILAYILEQNFLDTIKDKIVDHIAKDSDLEDLEHLIENIWSKKNFISFVLPFSIFWILILAIGTNLLDGKFVGFNFLAGYFIAGLYIGIGLNHLKFRLAVPSRLSRYEYKLYEINPIKSEVINHLTRLLDSSVYTVALYVAIATIFVSFINLFAWVSILFVLLGWIPITAQFIGNNTAIVNIIKRAKWKTLSKIQLQIQKLYKKDLSKEENIEALNRLIIFHDNIYSTPNSIFNFRTGLGFLNQLMIPLFGLLLANIDKLASLLREFLFP